MRHLAATAMSLLALVIGAVLAQDRFGFMPPGGIQLVERVLESCGDCDDLDALSGIERTIEEWRSYFAEREALEDLTEPETETLLRYLATVLPTDEPVEATGDLPGDGRSIVILQCQVCHSIATPMLEDREPAEWRQHRNRPPHDSFDLSDVAWRLIADYLAFNAPIEEASIPAEMLRGAGGY